MSKQKVVLPETTFLYTVDQIAYMLNKTEHSVRVSDLYYEGRSTGALPRHQMLARNIAPPGERPDWRVADGVFRKWMRFKGFKYYERGYYE